MGNFYPSGMDSGTDAARANFYFPNGKYPSYPMFSPNGAASVKRGDFSRKEVEQSPRVEIHPGAFQTPTSRGIHPNHPGEMSGRRADPGSFGCSPRDISTTKAVFNQQNNFINPGKEESSSKAKQGGKETMNPPNNFFNAQYPMPGYQQNYFMPQAGNTPTGGFAASPAGWSFNIPRSPNTGVPNIMSPFNVAAAFAQGDGSARDHLSPTFNATSDGKLHPGMMNGQDSARQYNTNFNQNYFPKNQPAQNFPMSPANAFSFS